MPKISTAKLKTELGFKIEVTPSHKIAEAVAGLKEQTDDAKDRYKRREEELQKQMVRDDIKVVRVRTAAGQFYEFIRENKGEKIKVKKIAETRAVTLQKGGASHD